MKQRNQRANIIERYEMYRQFNGIRIKIVESIEFVSVQFVGQTFYDSVNKINEVKKKYLADSIRTEQYR